jgi:ATP-binding cassette subfamily B protein
LIYTRAITVGQFFSLFIYSFFIFGPLQEIGNIINIYRETEASLNVYTDILRMPVEARPANPRPLHDLRTLAFEDVTFQHQSASSPAVSGISFRVGRGETIAFVGPSGAGKTTLVKLLVGLYQPLSGRIAYNGIPGSEIDLDGLRAQIGFVTQDTQLFSGTIRENLLFVNPGASDDECLDVLRRAACDSLLARADRGLDTVIGEGGVKVSGGEKQRLSIARALLRRPHLLHDSARRSDPRPRARPDRRDGPSRRARRPEGLVLRHVAAADWRAAGHGGRGARRTSRDGAGRRVIRGRTSEVVASSTLHAKS